MPRNSREILSNTCQYNISYLGHWGCLIAVNLQIYLATSSPQRANNVPKLQGVNYVAKNWALVMMFKALPLAHFSSALLLKQQMIISVKKNIKHAGQISVKSIDLQPNLPKKFPRNRPFFTENFRESVPENPAKFGCVFRNLPEALYYGVIHQI